jgi:hypothetical protein
VSGINDAHLDVAEVLLMFVRAGGGAIGEGRPLNEDWTRWRR